MPYRNRGKICTLMGGITRTLIYEPLQHAIGYACPSEEALHALAELAPLVEVGAGTGYWSALLKHRGVDVVAYDSHPPSADMANNFFYDFTFTSVHKGDGATLFAEKPELAARTLVLVWPNNPDDEDASAFALEDEGHTVWDADCLQAYLTAGGSTVVYVGERESQIEVVAGASRDSGITASRRFQRMLSEHFELKRELSIPHCFTAADDLTIWTRRV